MPAMFSSALQLYKLFVSIVPLGLSHANNIQCYIETGNIVDKECSERPKILDLDHYVAIDNMIRVNNPKTQIVKKAFQIRQECEDES